MVLDLIAKGGPVMWALLGASIFSFSLIFYKFFYLIRLVFQYKYTHDFQKICECIKNENFKDAKMLCLTPGPINKITHQGIKLLEQKHDKQTIKDTLDLIYDDESSKLENGLSIILITGEIMPMLGLLGTIAGMIHVFDGISIYATTNAQIMASGISEALITTKTGLALAIPILFSYTVLSQFVDNISKKLRLVAGSILNLVNQNTTSFKTYV